MCKLDYCSVTNAQLENHFQMHNIMMKNVPKSVTTTQELLTKLQLNFNAMKNFPWPHFSIPDWQQMNGAFTEFGLPDFLDIL